MPKKLTRQECERQRNIWVITACSSLVFLFFFVLVYITLGTHEERQLKSQLAECQHQLPSCNVEHGYYGFKVYCKDDYFGSKNAYKVIDQHYHKT